MRQIWGLGTDSGQAMYKQHELGSNNTRDTWFKRKTWQQLARDTRNRSRWSWHNRKQTNDRTWEETRQETQKKCKGGNRWQNQPQPLGWSLAGEAALKASGIVLEVSLWHENDAGGHLVRPWHESGLEFLFYSAFNNGHHMATTCSRAWSFHT